MDIGLTANQEAVGGSRLGDDTRTSLESRWAAFLEPLSEREKEEFESRIQPMARYARTRRTLKQASKRLGAHKNLHVRGLNVINNVVPKPWEITRAEWMLRTFKKDWRSNTGR